MTTRTKTKKIKISMHTRRRRCRNTKLERSRFKIRTIVMIVTHNKKGTQKVKAVESKKRKVNQKMTLKSRER